MTSHPSHRIGSRRPLFGGGALILTLSMLTGCASSGSDWSKLSLASPTTAAAQADGAQQAEAKAAKPSIAELAKAQAASPADAKIALQYARALKAAGKPKEALAVLDAVPESGPMNQALLVEQGLLSLEQGKATRARQLLLRATAEKTKDWRVYSGLGIASASLGMHAEAQGSFAKALELSPNNPTVLNNQAMSLILDRKIAQAEGLLQKATTGDVTQPRAKTNLALAKALKAEPSTGNAMAGADEPATAETRPMKAKHAAANETTTSRVD